MILTLETSAPAQTTLNVTNFGAIGDCANITVSVTSNSAVMTTTNTFMAGDVGKVVQLFGAGYFSSLSSTGLFAGNYHGTPTNHQDLVATILSVDASGTNVTLNRACGITTNNIRCTFGTDNRVAFSNCILAAQSNDVIYIPTGNYQLMNPDVLDTNFVMTSQYDGGATITLSKGGLTFLGDGTNSTILTANGAWQQKGYDVAYFGYLFNLNNGYQPPTNNGPLIFNGIQFNGNATRNHSALYTFWPPVPTDGSGWAGHHAFVDGYTPQGNIYKSWTNCLFIHWHGECIDGIAGGTNCFVDIGNCRFIDGNATVINYNYRHDFHDNWVEDYYQVAEDGQFLPGTGISYLRRNTFTNIYGVAAIALVGAYTNVQPPSYEISGNNFALSRYGIMTAGIKNVSIISNVFNGGGIILGAAGNQSTFWNSNIVVAFNTFTNVQVTMMFNGAGANRVEDVLVVSNTATLFAGGSSFFAESGQGANSWSTNVVFRYNTANKGLWSTWAAGQYFIDDPSNVFPFNAVNSSTTNKPVSYAYGMRQKLVATETTNIFYLDDSSPAQIPPTAVLLVTNSGLAAVLYTSASLVNPITMTNGYSVIFQWTNGVWKNVPYPSVVQPIILTSAAKLPNGAFQFAFTNTPTVTNYITTNITTTIITNWSTRGPPRIIGYTTNITMTVTTNRSENTVTILTTTNLLLSLTNWTVLGTVTDGPPGHFQFTDPQAANRPLRFYRVRSP
jgi:hypothetical protein